jgi:DNA-binding transcriptional LysR family regulator
MAVDGIGICMIPEAVMRAELAKNQLHLVDLNLNMPPIRFTATCRSAPEDGLVPSLARLAVHVSRSYADTHKVS